MSNDTETKTLHLVMEEVDDLMDIPAAVIIDFDFRKLLPTEQDFNENIPCDAEQFEVEVTVYAHKDDDEAQSEFWDSEIAKAAEQVFPGVSLTNGELPNVVFTVHADDENNPYGD